ncbi:unnamed protein product, partial [marine sediment metagenome]
MAGVTAGRGRFIGQDGDDGGGIGVEVLVGCFD